MSCKNSAGNSPVRSTSESKIYFNNIVPTSSSVMQSEHENDHVDISYTV